MSQLSHLQSKDFLFIIGSPRSGTTMLQVMLGSHPQVATTVELTLFSRYMAPWLSAWDDEVRNANEKGWNQGLPFVWKEADFIEYLHSFLNRSYNSVIADKPQATHVLDKHPGYSDHVITIKRLLPRARFLHIIRDGRDVACSMVAARRARGFGTATIPDSAVEWNRLVRAARKAMQFEDDYHEVRYEDMLARGAPAFAEVLDFCRLPYSSDWLVQAMAENSFEKMKEQRRTGNPRVSSSEAHYRKGRAGAWMEEFSAEDGYLFEKRAGPLLRELGYEKDSDWWSNSGFQRFVTKVRLHLRLR